MTFYELDKDEQRKLKAIKEGIPYQTPSAGIMKQFWGQHNAKHALTDQEITEAARAVARKRAC